MPQGYVRNAANCQGFLLQLNLYLATVHPAPSDREKVSALVSCLTGKALEWANALCLYHLRQETRSAQVFALEFRTLAAGTGWNNSALIDHYRCRLREEGRRELACRDTTLTFDQLVDLSIRLLLADVQIGVWWIHPPAAPLRYPWSWEGRCAGRPEGVPARAPSVAAEVTLQVGVGLVPLGIEAAVRVLWRHPR